MKHSSLFFAIILASSKAFAFTPFDFQSKIILNDIVEKILVIEEPDRMTEEQYAAANRLPIDKVKKLYGATGDFICNGPHGQFGQASLVTRNDVIVTAAHLVYNDLDCNKKVDLNQCQFRVEYNGKMQVLRITDIINAGQKCGQDQKTIKTAKCTLSKDLTSNQMEGITESKDWMALCLDHPVEGVEPYRIDTNIKPLELNNQQVISVGKSMDFIKKGKVDWRDLANHPKHIGYCRVREIYDWGAFGADDCDGSHGSSGGAILRRDTDLIRNSTSRVFIGIRSQIGETVKESERAARKGKMTRVKHNTLKLNSVFIPVQGELLQTLHELEKTR